MQIPGTTVVKLVCFDIGGVLVRVCGSWDEACHAAVLAPRDVPTAPAIDETRRALDARLELGRISFDDWAIGVSQVYEGAYSPEEAKRVHQAIPRREHEGASALVVELHEAGVPTACLFNTTHPHWVRLVHHDGVARLTGEPEYPSVARLERHLASHLLGLAKPDSSIYEQFERGVGLRGPDILFFDDRAENVDGARRRHWHAHRIDPAGSPIAEIRGYLQRYGVLQRKSSTTS